MKTALLIAAAILMAATNVASPIATEEPAAPGVVPKDEAVAFEEHQATVLVFLFPDCPVANRYAPEINAIYEDFEVKGVAFYRVYAGARMDEDAVAEHARVYRYRFAAVMDPDLELVRLTGARVTPEAVVFDAEGTRRYRGRINNRYVDFGQYRPAATVHDLRDALDAVLEGREVAEPVTESIGCFLPKPPDITAED